ncbi:PQQ-dependent sugar dehydrogenase [Sphaerisporangium dianthi]|uniref:PQQ-dependent sugar dehydrogenase n=1 Tax=Sphaerisporangium dianthi TaxID=1436120 RepID=A0ABV9CTA9_9ACTN
MTAMPVMRKRITSILTVAVAAVAAATVLIVTRPPAAGALATGGFDFTRAQVANTGLQVPWGIAFLPDGSGLVTERATARIMQVRPGATPTVAATVPNVVPSGEGGLLGIAVSPTYAQDQYVYVYYTASSDNRVVRLRLNAPGTQQVIVSGIPKNSFHNGGRLAFGPDGMLYVSTGDGGTTSNAQNQSSLGGKILRMTPTGGVPSSGNPFAGSVVYTLGHRNVQGMAWDGQGRMYASEFGQNTYDELNYIVAGANYGWPTCEGVCNNSSFRNPLVTWTTAEASPSGLAYANGTLFAGALRGTRLWTVAVNGGATTGSPVAEFQGTYGRLRAVVVGPDGWLWVTTSNRDGRGSPVSSDDRIIRVPPTGTTPSPSATPTLTPTPTPTPTVTPTPTPTPTPTVTPTPTPTPTAGRACVATYRISNQWTGGFQGEITVRNSGTAAIASWTVAFTFPNGQTISQMWGGRYTQSGSSVTVRNESWNGTVQPSGSTTAGFNGSWTGTNGTPSTIICTAT